MKIILINLIFLNTLIFAFMSVPMGFMRQGAEMGASMPIARDMVDESKVFMVNIYTKRNYALQDKLYLYSSVANKNNENSYLSKILAEKSFQFDEDSFIHIGGIASYDNENERAKARIHALYYDVDFFTNLLNIKIGREIKSFEYEDYFNIINFLSKSNYTYNPKDIFIKKNSIDGLSIRMNNSSGNNYMSVYVYEDDVTDDKEKVNYLLEISTLKKTFKSSVFLAKNDENISLALAFKQKMGESVRFKTSIRYDKNEDKSKSLSNSSSITYNINDNFLLGANYGVWKKELKEDDENIVFNHIVYTKFQLGDLQVKLGHLKDDREKANVSFGYNISHVKLYLDSFIDTKNDDKHLIRFMISYLD